MQRYKACIQCSKPSVNCFLGREDAATLGAVSDVDSQSTRLHGDSGANNQPTTSAASCRCVDTEMPMLLLLSYIFRTWIAAAVD